MIEMKPLVIGDLTVEKPVIQGGMGVGISLHRLAGAVAKAGGVGLISAAQIGFTEPDFAENPEEANARAIHKELKLAREIAPQGVLGFNIMVPMGEGSSKGRSGYHRFRSRTAGIPAGVCKGSLRRDGGNSRTQGEDRPYCIHREIGYGDL